MAVISVSGLSEDVAARLTLQGVRHGRSMETEVRPILIESLAGDEDDRPNLGQVIRERFAALGGVELTGGMCHARYDRVVVTSSPATLPGSAGRWYLWDPRSPDDCGLIDASHLIKVERNTLNFGAVCNGVT